MEQYCRNTFIYIPFRLQLQTLFRVHNVSTTLWDLFIVRGICSELCRCEYKCSRIVILSIFGNSKRFWWIGREGESIHTLYDDGSTEFGSHETPLWGIKPEMHPLFSVSFSIYIHICLQHISWMISATQELHVNLRMSPRSWIQLP